MNYNPLVSIIIVNYNGFKYLKECLDSILNNTYKNIEVIVVDNNSQDKSVSYVRKNYPNIILIDEKTNHGFAGGNNIGYLHSKGEIIILLNNDTKIEKDFITKFLNVFLDFPDCGAAQSKIVLYDNPEILDCAGSFCSPITILYHYGYLKKSDDKKFNIPYEIFSAKGASMIIKREVIERVGFFNERFWHYYEETDFCHRVVNSGYKIYYYPKATCYHKIGVSRLTLNNESKILFSNTKNKIYSYLINFELNSLVFDLLKHLLFLNFIILILLS